MHRHVRHVAGYLLAMWLWPAGASAMEAGDDAATDYSFRDCEDCPEVIVVPAGQFEMGSDTILEVMGESRSEGPVHTVTIRGPFALGRTEVTNRQFASFVEDSGYEPTKACSKYRGKVVQFGGDWTDPDYGRPPQPDEPVVCVSWIDAKRYVDWLKEKTGKSYRLPSEAEWEYAARAGSKSTWPWDGGADAVCRHANVFDREGEETDYARRYVQWPGESCSDGYGRVAPVASLQANAFGLHDMIGNVWEWLEDCWQPLYPRFAVDETAVQSPGACEKRAVRGGSWLTRLERQRPTFRGRDPESVASHIFGFRVARDLVRAAQSSRP